MIEVKELTSEQWKYLARDAHGSVFNAEINPDNERIDFALLSVLSPTERIIGYVTCREVDHETIYWQYGGSFPTARASIHVFKAYRIMLNYCALKYKRMTTLIENTNKAMLKMAAHCGLIITGVRTFNGKILLEHTLTFGGE